MYKYLLMILLLVVPGLAFSASFTVSQPGSTDPFTCPDSLCGSFGLPYADQGTVSIIEQYATGSGLFAGVGGAPGPTHAMVPGTTVTICGISTCYTYTKDDSGFWGNGHPEPRSQVPNTCPANPQSIRHVEKLLDSAGKKSGK